MPENGKANRSLYRQGEGLPLPGELRWKDDHDQIRRIDPRLCEAHRETARDRL